MNISQFLSNGDLFIYFSTSYLTTEIIKHVQAQLLHYAISFLINVYTIIQQKRHIYIYVVDKVNKKARETV